MRILIAVDDLVFGEALAEFAGRHQWPVDVEFKVLHVVEPVLLDHGGDVSYAPFLESTSQYAMQEARRLVGSVASKLRSNLRDGRIDQEVLEGHPAEQIIDTANAWGANMILLGSHGRRGMSRFILGSVSTAVLTHAPCSVVILRLPARVPAPSGQS
ncbi:MAG TPA: universal stress protein [Candidatus Obscuribacterales bacterium]